MCDCELCQVGRKSLLENYAYHYAKYHDAKDVLNSLEKMGVKPSFTKLDTNDPLNELACVMSDQALGSGTYLAEMEEKHPELKDWIKDEDS